MSSYVCTTCREPAVNRPPVGVDTGRGWVIEARALGGCLDWSHPEGAPLCPDGQGKPCRPLLADASVLIDRYITKAADGDITLKVGDFQVIDGDVYLDGMDPDEWLESMLMD